MPISQPDVTINVIPAALEVGNKPHRVLAIGQMLTGSASAGALVEDIQNDNSEDTLFGANSQLAAIIRAFKKVNKVTRIDAIPLADASGTPAAGTVAFANNATAAGTIKITVGSKNLHTYELAITSGMTPTQIGDALETAVNADGDCPVTASNSTGTVTLTCDHDGTLGNEIGLAYEIDGVTATTVTLTAFASGATDPSLTTVFDPIDNTRYHTIIWPGNFAAATLATELDSRFNVTNDILDGVGIFTKVDTYSNLRTAANALNSASLAPLGLKKLSDAAHKGAALLELPWVVSAYMAAIRALRLTEDANIAQYTISTNGARDSFGGTALASFPYFNTPFPLLPLIKVGKGFSREEIEGLLEYGMGTIGNNTANNTVIAGEIPTTYKTDSAGNEDPTFKFLNYVDTAVNAREYFFNNLKKRFAQSRLTEGDLVPNRSMANRQVIESYLDSLYNDLSGVDYVLTQSGEAALKFFRDNRSVELNMVEGKVTITMQVPIVVQLRTIVASLQIAFSTNS